MSLTRPQGLPLDRRANTLFIRLNPRVRGEIHSKWEERVESCCHVRFCGNIGWQQALSGLGWYPVFFGQFLHKVWNKVVLCRWLSSWQLFHIQKGTGIIYRRASECVKCCCSKATELASQVHTHTFNRNNANFECVLLSKTGADAHHTKDILQKWLHVACER